MTRTFVEDLIQRLRSEIADSTIKVDAANGAHARAAAATRAAVAQAGASGDRKLELLHDAAQREEAWALGHYQHLKNINEQLLEDQSLLMASLPGPVQVALTDSSSADCARMLSGLPEVPHSIEDFQQYLKTGAVALTPFFHSLLIAEHPHLQESTFAAGSEGSFLAQSMGSLVRSYKTAPDYELHHGEEFIGHRMSAFTVDIWTALWEHAPNQCKLLGFNKRPSENLRYHSKWQAMRRPTLTVSIDGLVLFIGKERASSTRLHIATSRGYSVCDIESDMKDGLPPIFYQDIPYIPVYAAAGDEIQFGLLLANGEVKMSKDVYKLFDVRDRVECMAASIAIYRLFACLLKLAPIRDPRVYFPLGSSFGDILNRICRPDIL